MMAADDPKLPVVAANRFLTQQYYSWKTSNGYNTETTMRRELIFLAIGGVLGAAAVLSGQQYSSIEDENSATSRSLVLSPEPEKAGAQTGEGGVARPIDTDIQPSAGIVQNEYEAQREVKATSLTADGRRPSLVHSAVPDPYDSLLKPKELPKNLRTPELYERFKNDVRDNSWADAMELGINQYIAERGPDLEVVFDFVECRSRYCVVAGVSYSQDRGPWNTFNPEMRSSGWWLASGGNSTVGGTYGNETRFATVISRDPSDTIRPAPSDDSSNRLDESGIQSVKVGMASR